MKKILFVLAILSYSQAIFSQMQFSDYKDDMRIQIGNITYKTDIGKAAIMDQLGKVGVILEDEKNFRMGGSQYADGSPVIYSPNMEEVAEIIIPREYYHRTLHEAMRSAFTKQELIDHPKNFVVLYVVVDSEGAILETSTYYRISKDYVIQPEQIAALESSIRKNLKFEVTTRANNFNYFEGEFFLFFQEFIEDMPEIILKEEEGSFGDLPYVEGGNLTGPPKAGGGN
ncbi:MAG: hypothetical protein E7137_05175 [Rikenellaceae bacterium]|nr:hypothetical protein [Rikenellaceae bacterium]